MKIRFYAHACFRLETDALSVITDPYQPGDFSGFESIDEPADIVVRSSPTDDFHNDPSHVEGDPTVIDAMDLPREGKAVRGLELRPFPNRERFVWWGIFVGWLPRRNAMYHMVFPDDDLRVFHTGDIGRAMKPDHLAALEGQVDVMLAITGATHNIKLEDMQRAIQQIRPRVVIPMHYHNPKGVIPGMLPVEAFTELYPEDRVVRVGGPEVEILRQDLPDETRVYVLEPCR